jgi:EmrB/QacA subfamily drug resistance transporter
MKMYERRWLTLGLLALAQFMVVLDLTIVNVALPSMQRHLHFSTDGLQWVVNAYTLAFGGFLLLGGRAADLIGRRRVFVTGLGLFTTASLVAGLAGSPGMLVAARAAQGLGGALLSPAALSLLTVTFAHGRERNIAIGVWGALAGIGGTVGIVAGGLLVDALGWASVFFVNVPIGIALIAATLRVVPESRDQLSGRRSLDVPGALLSTAGMLALVLGVVRSEPLGWGSTEVVACLMGGVVLLAAFVTVEARVATPLVPLQLFAGRSLRLGSVSLALNGATFLAMFFLTAIYLQQVRGESALTTGLQLLPMGLAAVAAAVVGSQLVTRIGTRPVQVAGTLFSVAGLLLLAQTGGDPTYARDLMPGFILFGIGVIGVGVSGQIAAVAEVPGRHAGAASGVINAAYQIGGALGLAVITTLSESHVMQLLHAGTSRHDAFTRGFDRGLTIAAILATVNALVAFASPQIKPTADQLAAAAAA